MKHDLLVRKSLKDQIKEILINRIVAGECRPGDRIKELVVAREFGTSQAPVREAIRCLETLGYVEHVPHVGAMVKSYNRREIEEAYQVREALEVYSVTLAAGTIDHLVAKLEGCLGEMKTAVENNSIQQFTRADNTFHEAIVTFSQNDTMLSLWKSLNMQLHVVATLVDASMPLDKIFDLHPPIVEALKKQLLAAASSLLTSHYLVIGAYWKDVKE